MKKRSLDIGKLIDVIGKKTNDKVLLTLTETDDSERNQFVKCQRKM